MSAEGISSKVRRIAILVTSLDASAGRQLLMAMPTELARQVRRAMSQLGSIDPEEQRQVMAEFRMQALTGEAQPTHVGATSPSKNASSGYAAPSNHATSRANDTEQLNQAHANQAQSNLAYYAADQAQSSTSIHRYSLDGNTGDGRAQRPWQHLDVATLYELLRGERATVVAVVLSQLEPRHGAELLGKLPRPLQREAVVSLSRLGQIDPDAMAAIDEHLAGRIADYHHRQAGESESTNRMQELFAAAAPDLRSDWQSTLYQAEPQLASRMGITPPPIPAPVAQEQPRATPATQAQTQANTRVASPKPAARGASMLELLANNVVTTADPRLDKTPAAPIASTQPTTPTSVPSNNATHAATVNSSSVLNGNDARPRDEMHDDDRARILPFPTKATHAHSLVSLRFDQLLDLPAEEIGQVLAAADTDVILYALAGASPTFMKRFMNMLDRADGKALQAQLKQLRSINLKDVDAAQLKLCELAEQRRVTKVAA